MKRSILFVAAWIVSATAWAQGTRVEPDWLTPYPRAQLGRQFVNPFDVTNMPLTLPGSGATTTRYAVPVQGKVTILIYRHEADDSPLLVLRHYDAVLAQRGFERVVACSQPCPATGGASRWMKMVDPGRPDDFSYFPDAPLLLIGYKADAMAFVAVGKNANYPYATFIKLVEGEIRSRTDLDLWLASLRPAAPPPAPSSPALVAPQAGNAPPARSGVTSDVVEGIAPARLANAVAQTRGKVFVMLSSTDPNCGYCARANPVFLDFASRHADQGRFISGNWQPWPTVESSDFARANNIRGLPAFLVFRDGAVAGRVDGAASLDELERGLLADRPR